MRAMLGEVVSGITSRASTMASHVIASTTAPAASRVAVASVGARGEQRETHAAFSFGMERIRGGERELLTPSAGRRLARAESNGRLAAPQHAREPRVRILGARGVEADRLHETARARRRCAAR